MSASRPEVIAFLQAIKETPEDDTPRLILADWLEERGDPRGELLRLQVAQGHLIPGTKAWRDRLQGEEALRSRHEKDWLSDLATLARRWTWERGLVRLTLPVHVFLGREVAALAATETFAWVDGARLVLAGRLPWLQEMEKLAQSPLLAGLNVLNLGNQGLGANEVMLLAGAPALDNLRVLELYGNRPSAPGVGALARSPFLAALTTLDLDGCGIGAGGAEAVATGKNWRRLTTLQLRTNRIGDEGAAALAVAPALASLKALHLNSNDIGDPGALALADSPYLDNLEALDLLGNPILGPGLDALRARFGDRVTV